MAYLNDRVLDNGLSILSTDANAIHICSQEPTTYAEAITTYTLGNKASPSIAAPSARTPNGRKVTVSAITGGSVTATGTASHYAIVDTVNSQLLATTTLTSSQAVTSGNTWSSASSFDIGIPAAV